MARAKRTDRTEARRRSRAEQAPEGVGAVDGDEFVHQTAAASASTAAPARRKGTAPAGSAPAASSAPASASGRPARPSFTTSARTAYRTPHLREDLAYLPRLLLHWGVLLSAALAIVGTSVFITTGTTSSATGNSTTTIGYVSSMLVSLFVGPPPFGAALLIGFMLPRATYLVGFVFGLLASACFTAIILAQPAETAAGVSIPVILLQVWILGPIGTMFFAAGIAWYKRFLDLLNPNRGQRGKTSQKNQPKPQQGRGNAPRNRLSGSGK